MTKKKLADIIRLWWERDSWAIKSNDPVQTTGSINLLAAMICTDVEEATALKAEVTKLKEALDWALHLMISVVWLNAHHDQEHPYQLRKGHTDPLDTCQGHPCSVKFAQYRRLHELLELEEPKP